jgi:hypothetical protein
MIHERLTFPGNAFASRAARAACEKFFRLFFTGPDQRSLP